jgi:hypothetical protein
MANTAIIPLKAIRTGSQATGDVTALGEFESGDRISSTYLTGVALTTTFNAALANTNAYIATTAATERSSLANTNAYIATTAATERSSLANTNAYIATKAPTATPTFTGNATFDTDTLFVDSSNDRVGMGTTSPAATVDISGNVRGAVVTDNDLSFDLSASNNFSCTPSGGGTLTFTNHLAGQSGFVWLDNSGGHAIAAAGTTKINATDLTAISTAGIYTLSYFDNGTNAYVSVSRSFA